MLSCVIQGSLVLARKVRISSSWPLPPQLAMATITPSIRSLPTTVSNSGAPMWPPLVMIGSRPLPRPISLSFSSTSLVSGTLVVSTSSMSGRALRTFCTSEVASDSGGVKVSSTTSLRPSLSKPPSRIGLVKLTGEAVLSMMMPMVLGVATCASLATSITTGSASLDCLLAVGEVWNTYL